MERKRGVESEKQTDRQSALAGCVPVEGREQAAGGEHERPTGEDGSLIVDPLQVASGHVSHADGTR